MLVGISEAILFCYFSSLVSVHIQQLYYFIVLRGLLNKGLHFKSYPYIRVVNFSTLTARRATKGPRCDLHRYAASCFFFTKRGRREKGGSSL
jgi:hypothetical protein